jgi:hypothetical protein
MNHKQLTMAAGSLGAIHTCMGRVGGVVHRVGGVHIWLYTKFGNNPITGYGEKAISVALQRVPQKIASRFSHAKNKQK